MASYETKPSPLGGCGIFATRNFYTGEEIMCDSTNLLRWSKKSYCTGCYKVNCSYDIKRCQSCHVQYCSLECKAKDSAYHQSRCQAFAWANGSEKSGITHLPETLANLTRWEKTEGDVYLKLALELRPRAYDASEKAQIVAIQAALPEATQKFCSSEQFFTLVGVIANNSFTVSNGTLILLPLVSRLHQASIPNAFSFGSQIHATKFIAKGEEVLIPYTYHSQSGNLFLPTVTRFNCDLTTRRTTSKTSKTIVAEPKKKQVLPNNNKAKKTVPPTTKTTTTAKTATTTRSVSKK